MRPGADRLEAELRDLTTHVWFPAGQDLSGTVVERLDLADPPRRSAILLRPAVAMSVVLTVSLTSLLVLSPASRKAVASWLGLPGVRIELDTRSPTPTPTAGIREGLGTKMSLEEARQKSEFSILHSSSLGPADEIWFHPFPQGGRVSLIWHPTEELPETKDPSVAVFLTQFIGRIEQDVIAKASRQGTVVETVRIGDSTGYWLGEESHFFLYLDKDGRVRQETIRLAANTLLWTSGDLTLRLESSLPKEDAIGIAETFR